jgi:hypothetical protein
MYCLYSAFSYNSTHYSVRWSVLPDVSVPLVLNGPTGQQNAWKLAVRVFQLIRCTVLHPPAFAKPSEQTACISSYGFGRVDQVKSRFSEYGRHELGIQLGRIVSATSQMCTCLSQWERSRLHHRPESR